MRFWIWLAELYAGEEKFVAAMGIAAGTLVLAAALACFWKTTGAFTATFAVAFGTTGILIAYEAVGEKAGLAGLSILSIFGGFLYLLLLSVLTIVRTILERKRRRAEIERRLCYTLPDRENGYVRERLNVALKIPETELGEDVGGSFDGKEFVKLEHARLLLNKIKEAPLSQAERLQTEEIGKTFSLYVHKEKWSPADLRAVNEICGILLKLSAKYAV